jgi:hypothetical protein
MKIKAAIATILATLILAPAAAGWAIGSWQGAFIIWGVIGTPTPPALHHQAPLPNE